MQKPFGNFEIKRTKRYCIFYAIQVFVEGKIANLFWANGRSIVEYAYFGDVVSFYTTFNTNKYDLTFASLLGITHHKQTIVFGVALLFDQTESSFIWLFKTFLFGM